MIGECLLDTNVVIRLFAHDEAVEQRFNADPKIIVPVVVFGELYYGAENSRRVQENCERIEKFITLVEPLGSDIGTAFEFGRLKYELQLKGRMIPENDLWIAALARQYDLTLVSSDRHFSEVENLRWEQW